MNGIVATDDVLGGEPRLADRRIAVRQIVELVIEGRNSPAAVADQLDVPVADIHLALAYYYRYPEEIADAREQHRDGATTAKEQALDPPEKATR